MMKLEIGGQTFLVKSVNLDGDLEKKGFKVNLKDGRAGFVRGKRGDFRFDIIYSPTDPYTMTVKGPDAVLSHIEDEEVT